MSIHVEERCCPGMVNRYVTHLLLLLPSRLEVKQSPQGNCVPGLTEVPVTSNEEVAELMARCDRNRSALLPLLSNHAHYTVFFMTFSTCIRSQATTDMNEHSSRSHMMLQVIVESQHRVTNQTSRGKMNLVSF